jgi:hypothetical protein
MLQVRKYSILAALAAILSLIASTPSVRADRDYRDDHVHLDYWETRQVVRHLEEHNDTLQDRIYDWLSQRRDEREHRADDLLRALDHFDQNLAQFKLDLYHHQDPWDLRDNAQNIVDTARDLGHAIERNEWHDEFHHEWEQTRDDANDLARRFHLHEID